VKDDITYVGLDVHKNSIDVALAGSSGQLKLQLMRYSNEIQMRKMQPTKLFREKAEFTTRPDLAMAHRVVSGMESLPKEISRGR
jgi:hypothetical protein